MEKYLIVKDSLKKIRKFGVQGRSLEFKIKPTPENVEPVKWIKEAIEGIVLKGTEGLNLNDKVGFTFCSKDFIRGDGWMRFKLFKDIDTVQAGADVPGLFTEMMNKFIKIKQESSDWPVNCQTQSEKDRYIEGFLQRENVQLEVDKICNNPGLRSLAKLMLNSFWGKFGQRENQPKTSIVNKPDEFFSLFTNPSIYVNSFLPVNEDTLIINWVYKEECYDPLPSVNVVIAAYVTALARLKLYRYLDKLGENVLYYDTDSCIYVSKPGGYEVPTGADILCSKQT